MSQVYVKPEPNLSQVQVKPESIFRSCAASTTCGFRKQILINHSLVVESTQAISKGISSAKSGFVSNIRLRAAHSKKLKELMSTPISAARWSKAQKPTFGRLFILSCVTSKFTKEEVMPHGACTKTLLHNRNTSSSVSITFFYHYPSCSFLFEMTAKKAFLEAFRPQIRCQIWYPALGLTPRVWNFKEYGSLNACQNSERGEGKKN